MNQGIYIDMIVKSVVENMIVGAILASYCIVIILKRYETYTCNSMFHSAQCCFCSGTDVLYEYYVKHYFTVGSGATELVCWWITPLS